VLFPSHLPEGGKNKVGGKTFLNAVFEKREERGGVAGKERKERKKKKEGGRSSSVKRKEKENSGKEKKGEGRNPEREKREDPFPVRDGGEGKERLLIGGGKKEKKKSLNYPSPAKNWVTNSKKIEKRKAP